MYRGTEDHAEALVVEFQNSKWKKIYEVLHICNTDFPKTFLHEKIPNKYSTFDYLTKVIFEEAFISKSQYKSMLPNKIAALFYLQLFCHVFWLLCPTPRTINPYVCDTNLKITAHLLKILHGITSKCMKTNSTVE